MMEVNNQNLQSITGAGVRKLDSFCACLLMISCLYVRCEEIEYWEVVFMLSTT